MNVLVVSHDAEAAASLRGALLRAGQTVHWSPDGQTASQEVADTSELFVIVSEADEATQSSWISELVRRQPWTRLHLLAGASDDDTGSLPVIRKPFDATEVADLLVREQVIARGERDRHGLSRELEHQKRLAEVGRLAATMAHEINNPLSVVAAAVAPMMEAAERLNDRELSEHARDVELSVERIRSFVEHVSGFTRRGHPELHDASLNGTLDVALRLVRPRARDRGVEVTVKEGPNVHAPHDAPRLSQAMLNVLSNAVDAAAEGGRTMIVELTDDAGDAVIRVDDTGPGVDPSIATRLFEPFATTKPVGRGTGLGLSITRQIVDDHHGSICLVPRPQGGTRAEIRLPAFRPENHTVLVVEDDPSVCRALAADLRRGGFRVEAASSVAEAVAWMRDHRCSVIVSDATLGDGSSEEVLRSAAELQPRAGRLLISAATDASDRRADRRLSKPWDRERLLATICDLCLLER